MTTVYISKRVLEASNAANLQRVVCVPVPLPVSIDEVHFRGGGGDRKMERISPASDRVRPQSGAGTGGRRGALGYPTVNLGAPEAPTQLKTHDKKQLVKIAVRCSARPSPAATLGAPMRVPVFEAPPASPRFSAGHVAPL